MRRTNIFGICLFAMSSFALANCDAAPQVTQRIYAALRPASTQPVHTDWKDERLAFGLRLSAAAEERATHFVLYDAAYEQITYPNGDVAADRGVCSDEVVRAYRLLGIDLQKLVHEDMRRAFHVYPMRWGLKVPDSNIDHRRVPNLATFFTRHGTSLTPSLKGDDYKPGDVVAWALADGRPHVGLVTERRSGDGERPLVMHNIGMGPQIEDMLFGLTITGHFRYEGPRSAS
jgi:uncharacterized protein YijF (DUF1287 family)